MSGEALRLAHSFEYLLTYLLTPYLAGEDEGDVGTEAKERVVLLGLVDL